MDEDQKVELLMASDALADTLVRYAFARIDQSGTDFEFPRNLLDRYEASLLRRFVEPPDESGIRDFVSEHPSMESLRQKFIVNVTVLSSGGWIEVRLMLRPKK